MGPDFPEKKTCFFFYSTEQVMAATGTSAKKIAP